MTDATETGAMLAIAHASTSAAAGDKTGAYAVVPLDSALPESPRKAGGLRMTFTFDLSWPSNALSPNGRPHHFAKARAVKSYRQEAWAKSKGAGVRPSQRASVAVVFFPKPKGPAPDLDNAIASFKAAQDGLADALGMNDRDMTVTHEISTERAGCVRVTVVTPDP